ncbi:PilZ domain-containing protein [Modestobacter italicus]|uniref:PilZ domain-containing protein n=1 Tax=Modestobacter italicus (strain DSM 44449 / CECT 9708 / BC 501) TaxID=2732864 RepID=UPI001C94F53E|nr:PilZ domain-containing protein [Modestobacter italicus]
MVAGQPNVDHPVATTALSVMPLGQDEALTARVRRETDSFLYISSPRNGVGEAAPFVERDMLELSWQSDDGLRSVPAEALAVADDGTWKVKITGPASRIQRRDSVRAPIGLSVTLSWDRTTLVGSTVDLSEGGLLAVFRPHGDLGVGVPFPKRGQPLALQLDLYSDQLVTEVALVRRRPRQDNLHEWSLRFVALPEPSADLIRSHVFTALRNARARGLAAIY